MFLKLRSMGSASGNLQAPMTSVVGDIILFADFEDDDLWALLAGWQSPCPIKIQRQMDAICGANYMWGLSIVSCTNFISNCAVASQFTRLGCRFQDLSTCAKNIAWNIGEGRSMFGMRRILWRFSWQ
jgi:hypothetical protein